MASESNNDEEENQCGCKTMKHVGEGFRFPLPLRDDLLVNDALARGSIPQTAAVALWCGLQKEAGVPVEVVNQILAFYIPRQLYKSPYLAPQAVSKANGLQRYTKMKELREIVAKPLGAVAEHNVCFTTVSPFALKLNEVFSIPRPLPHQNGFGIVTERFDVAKSHLRFCKESVVCYYNIDALHGKAEEELKARGQSVRGLNGLSLHVGRNPHNGLIQRYFILSNSGRFTDQVYPPYPVWVPLHFDYPNLADEAEAHQVAKGSKNLNNVGASLPPLFAGIQVWNNGTVDFSPELTPVSDDPLGLSTNSFEDVRSLQ